MLDLEKLWRAAPGDMPVCTKTKTTKNMVLKAITEGARDLDSIKKIIPLCSDNNCKMDNLSGRGCKENVEILLSIYVPIYEFMTEGGGCEHDHKSHIVLQDSSDCEKKSANGCGDCKSCMDSRQN